MLLAKKKDFRSGKNISRICLEILLKSLINLLKKLDIKLEQCTEEELDTVLKKIKSRKAGSLDKIPPEILKIRKFDNIDL